MANTQQLKARAKRMKRDAARNAPKGKVIKVKLRDSVSVSDGRGSSGGRSSSGGGGIKATRLVRAPRPQTVPGQRPPSVRAPRPQTVPGQIRGVPTIRGVPKTSAGFLIGAKAFAKVSKLSPEEREKLPNVLQTSVGISEGIANTAFAVGSIPPTLALDVKGVIEGKPFGEGSKQFREDVLSNIGQRESSLTQLFAGEKVKTDRTSVFRSVGEVAPFAIGARSGPRVPKTPAQSRPQFGFTKTELELGRGNLIRDGPAFKPSDFQSIPTVNLGRGTGKVKLRSDQPPRSPFLDDVKPRGKSEVPFGLGKQFKSTEIGLGKTITKRIGAGTQRQSSGLETIVKQTTKKGKQPKSEIDILRQKPRFESTKIKAGEASFETIRFPKGGKSNKGLLGAGVVGLTVGSAAGAGQKGKLTTDVIPKIDTGLKTGISTRSTSRGGGGFKLSDRLDLQLTPGLKQPPLTQQSFFPGPPGKPPKITTFRPAAFAPFGRPISLGSFGGTDKGSTRAVFGAFAISKNINVGRLPGPLSEFSTSPKVFGKLDKRDKAFQDAIFGKPTRKRKSKKTSKKKKKR